jgi:hypothetical protein
MKRSQMTKISTLFLADVNASLPEYKKLDSHPEYLSSTDNGNIEPLQMRKFTFVHEGAGYKMRLDTTLIK